MVRHPQTTSNGSFEGRDLFKNLNLILLHFTICYAGRIIMIDKQAIGHKEKL